MTDVFQLEGFFVQNGEDTVTRLEGRVSIPVAKKLTAEEVQKALKGNEGILVKIAESVSERMGTAVQVWSDGVSIREDAIVWSFRVTILDFDGFDMLRDEIRKAFKGVTS